MRSVRLLLTALVLGLLLSACGQEEIDAAWVEGSIVDSVLDPGAEANIGIVRATCPEHVPAIAGRHFTCTVRVEDQDPVDVDVRIDDVEDIVSVSINMPGEFAIPKSRAR